MKIKWPEDWNEWKEFKLRNGNILTLCIEWGGFRKEVLGTAVIHNFGFVSILVKE